MKKIVLLGLASMFYLGCDYRVDHQTGSLGSGTEVGSCIPEMSTSPINTAPTYEIVKTKIFDSKCMRCHQGAGASAGVDLSSYARAKKFAAQIDFQVSRNLMPRPPATLTPEEKGMISDWVKAGAPSEVALQTCGTNQTGGNVPVTNPVNEPVTPIELPLESMPADSQINFELIKNKVFSFYCLSCHSNEGGNRSGLNLETYENTIDEIKDIQQEVFQGTMPPRLQLGVLERAVLLRWISLGTPK